MTESDLPLLLRQTLELDPGQYLLGVVGEVSIEHPAEIARIFLQHLTYRLSSIFTEIETFFFLNHPIAVGHDIACGISFFFPYDSACKIDVPQPSVDEASPHQR